MLIECYHFVTVLLLFFDFLCRFKENFYEESAILKSTALCGSVHATEGLVIWLILLSCQCFFDMV